MLLIRSLLELFVRDIVSIKVMLGLVRLDASDLEFLEEAFPYFRGLNERHKRDFRKRLLKFLEIKSFIPRGGLTEVTREMRLLISATAVMVTFGFSKVRLKHFSRILVYPGAYYSTINRQYHFGEVNPRLGIIVLSWDIFLRGMSIPNDGVNLGIHEMAHALKLENQIHYNRESGFFNLTRWKDYAVLAEDEMEKIRKEEPSPYRSSAARNTHEFFASSLELFFEKPQELRAYCPALYQSLVFLLKQDPIGLVGDA